MKDILDVDLLVSTSEVQTKVVLVYYRVLVESESVLPVEGESIVLAFAYVPDQVTTLDYFWSQHP